MPQWLYSLIGFLKMAGKVIGALIGIVSGIESLYGVFVPAH